VETLHALAEREHTLHALIDLNQGFTVTLDLYKTVDHLLLNLMGQLGTSRAVLWLLTDDPSATPILIRSYGWGHDLIRALLKVCGPRLVQRLCEDAIPMTAAGIEVAFGSSKAALLRKEGIAILAPLRSSGSTLGFVALGPRVDGADFTPLDIEVLEAALGIAGVAIQNGETYNRLLESRRQLLLANEELKQLDSLKSGFLTNVNHELRTPLCVIVSSLECAVEMKPGTAEQRKLLQNSLSQARRLFGMVDNLLTLSEVSRDTLSLRVVEHDVIRMLEQFHAKRLPGVSAGRRELLLDVPSRLAPAQFDDHRISQILDALVDNAVKFTLPGSRIVLRASEMVRDETRWVRIEVEDEGPGIPSDQLPTLFDPFQKPDVLTARVGGMGVGLALAHDLAERMGGRLLASSAPGQGSTFTLLLRASEQGGWRT
jgi:signal transduction histidine kinase